MGKSGQRATGSKTATLAVVVAALGYFVGVDLDFHEDAPDGGPAGGAPPGSATSET